MANLRTLLFAALALLTSPLVALGQSPSGPAPSTSAPAISTAIPKYASRPIRLVVPYPPGGGLDLFARPVAQKMGESLGQPVIVENRSGASGVIGADLVAKAVPDGYTLLIAFASQYLQPFVSKHVPFDNLRDFSPVIAAARAPNMIVVHPSLPVTSVKELIEYARSNPGKVAYVTAGANTSQHLSGLMLAASANIDILHVPYKGGGPAMNDLLGGQVQMGILIMGTVMPHIQSGKLRALAVVESTRASGMPGLPTVAESGLPGYAMPPIWIGVLGPRGLPSAIVARLNAEIGKVIVTPDVNARLAVLGYEVTGSTTEQFADIIARTVEAYRKAVSAAGIHPE